MVVAHGAGLAGGRGAVGVDDAVGRGDEVVSRREGEGAEVSVLRGDDAGGRDVDDINGTRDSESDEG